MINIIIGGDLCPINRNLPLFQKGDAKSIFHDLLIEFENADLSIVNLECPLINENTPIIKEGPVHAVSSDCINGIKALNIDVLCLANNHILDHGAKGLLNTLRVCTDAGLVTVGAGENLKAASKIIVKEIKGIRIGILGVAEHEFSIATEDTPGANPLDIISIVRTIKSQKNEFDYLIVLVHAGASEYPLPSPRLRDICRFIVEMGADVVICQHSHCAGSFERYEDSYIVYGQGNLIFDGGELDSNSTWNKGFLVMLTIDKDDHFMNIVPYVQSAASAGAKKMPKDEESIIIEEIKKRSLMISDSSLIKKEWIKECNKNKNKYFFYILFGFLNNRLFSMIHRNIPFAKYFYTRKHLTLLENMFKCESHREIIETILEEGRKDIKGK